MHELFGLKTAPPRELGDRNAPAAERCVGAWPDLQVALVLDFCEKIMMFVFLFSSS